MMGRVTVADQLYEQQYIKVVATSDGDVQHLPPGRVPEPTGEVLATLGEPSFAIHLARDLATDEDVPDDVGLAVRRAARRLHHVMEDGREEPGGAGPVEGIFGPVVSDGGLVVCLDTDGVGAGAAMVGAMARILVEELAPLDLDAHVSAGPSFSDAMLSGWMTTSERQGA